MAKVSADNKQIARRASLALGGTFRVQEFWDEPSQHSVDLLICSDAPRPGLTSFSTVTLSDWPLIKASREVPVRIELVGACHASAQGFANALVTAALSIMKEGWFCRPGVVFETLLSMYGLSETMEHLYFTSPSVWGDLATTIELTTKKVTWLWAIPVSEAESRFINEHGDNRFESLLKNSGTDVFDVTRPSIV